MTFANTTATTPEPQARNVAAALDVVVNHANLPPGNRTNQDGTRSMITETFEYKDKTLGDTDALR